MTYSPRPDGTPRKQSAAGCIFRDEVGNFMSDPGTVTGSCSMAWHWRHLGPSMIRSICLRSDELRSYCFVSLDEAVRFGLLAPRSALAAIDRLEKERRRQSDPGLDT